MINIVLQVRQEVHTRSHVLQRLGVESGSEDRKDDRLASQKTVKVVSDQKIGIFE